jgi:hypothetical protein
MLRAYLNWAKETSLRVLYGVFLIGSICIVFGGILFAIIWLITIHPAIAIILLFTGLAYSFGKDARKCN